MAGMDSIIHINEADSDMVVQSGVRWEEINSTLEEKGEHGILCCLACN